jgi:hypothetical protein
MICFDEIKVFLQFNYSLLKIAVYMYIIIKLALPFVEFPSMIQKHRLAFRSIKRICLFNQVSVKRNYFLIKHPTMILSLLNA